MSTIQDIQRAIQGLSPDELAAFRAWFTAYDAKAWDRHVADDLEAERLGVLSDEAQAELRPGPDE